MIPLSKQVNVNGVNIQPPPSSGLPSATSSDVLIVGAGIVGLAHAAHAVANGLTVTILERDHRAVGASIRNFGHCCITAQSGDLYEMAQTSRKYWLEFAGLADFWAAESGAMVLARTESEMAVLRELSGEREQGQVELLTPTEVRARLGSGEEMSVPDGGTSSVSWPALVGGAFLRDDLRVDPRTTVAKLAQWLSEQPGVNIHWNTAALGFGSEAGRSTVRTTRGNFHGERIFVCVGHDVDYLFPDLAEEHGIERCALQMSLAAQPPGLHIKPAILTATSMLRYQAFTDTAAANALRAEMEQSRPELLGIGANVMFTQRPDGTVILGDSHHYHHTAPPFLKEGVTTTVNMEIESAIGAPLDIVERWQGIYASSSISPLLVRDVQRGVTVVSVTSGVGMTLSFGLAHRNIARLY